VGEDKEVLQQRIVDLAVLAVLDHPLDHVRVDVLAELDLVAVRLLGNLVGALADFCPQVGLGLGQRVNLDLAGLSVPEIRRQPVGTGLIDQLGRAVVLALSLAVVLAALVLTLPIVRGEVQQARLPAFRLPPAFTPAGPFVVRRPGTPA